MLFSAYEAWTKGGDVRALGVAGIKYLALGALFMNDGAVYERVFRDILAAFNQISHTMAGVGPTDVFKSWANDIYVHGSLSTTFLNLVAGHIPGLLSALLLLIAMIVYPVAYALFAVFYSLYGTILFVTGPLVLALMPSFGLGALARRYAINVMIFGAWGLIYGIFCRLAIAINVHSMAALTSANSFAGVLAGASQEILLAVASILFSVCILLIPLLAKRIVEGDLGGSMLTVLGAATTMAQSLMSLAAGASGGAGGMQGAAAGGGGGAGCRFRGRSCRRFFKHRSGRSVDVGRWSGKQRHSWRFSFAAWAIRWRRRRARTWRLPVSQYSARCRLAWRSGRCHGDARWTKRSSCWPEDASGAGESDRRLLQRCRPDRRVPESVDEWV